MCRCREATNSLTIHNMSLQELLGHPFLNGMAKDPGPTPFERITWQLILETQQAAERGEPNLKAFTEELALQLFPPSSSSTSASCSDRWPADKAKGGKLPSPTQPGTGQGGYAGMIHTPPCSITFRLAWSPYCIVMEAAGSQHGSDRSLRVVQDCGVRRVHAAFVCVFVCCRCLE
jgi:hypothetical protein